MSERTYKELEEYVKTKEAECAALYPYIECLEQFSNSSAKRAAGSAAVATACVMCGLYDLLVTRGILMPLFLFIAAAFNIALTYSVTRPLSLYLKRQEEPSAPVEKEGEAQA